RARGVGGVRAAEGDAVAADDGNFADLGHGLERVVRMRTASLPRCNIGRRPRTRPPQQLFSSRLLKAARLHPRLAAITGEC
ncbi:hypothetical protein DF186_18360, partial [Enterococcus hirae]